MLALAGLELEMLDIVDIGESGQHATDLASRPSIGVIIDTDPESAALDRGELAFEADALAGKGCLEISMIKLVEVAPVDLDDCTANDFGLCEPGPVDERALHETIVLVNVDVAARQNDRL